MNKNNIKLLDENDFFICNGASDSQMLKMKLDMQHVLIIRLQLMKQMLILNYMVCLLVCLTFKLLYISKCIYELGPLCSPHYLLFPNYKSISTKPVESVLSPSSLSQSDLLIT